MAATKTFSGARAVFLIDGAPVAFAGGTSGGEEIQYDPVDVLSLLEVREFVPVAYHATLNAQIFRVVGSSIKALGILPTEDNILTSGELKAAIQDTITGETIALFTGVKCSGHNFDVTARGIVQEQVSFVCIRLQDEFEVPA